MSIVFIYKCNKILTNACVLRIIVIRKVVYQMANVNIRMDDDTKRQFDQFCSEVGISVSAAFNLFAKRVIKEQRIPFDITSEVPNKTTRAAIREAEYMSKHPELFKSYRTAEELFEDILNEEV